MAHTTDIHRHQQATVPPHLRTLPTMHILQTAHSIATHTNDVPMVYLLYILFLG